METVRAAAFTNLGTGLRRLGRLNDAARQYRRALEAEPGLAEAHSNLATVLFELGLVGEAVGHYREALRLRHDLARTHSNLLLALHCDPACTPRNLFEEHRAYAQQHARPLSPLPLPPNDAAPERRLRLGYASADFRAHSVAHFIAPVLAAHDRRHFEVYCYASVASPDPTTTRLRSHADVWRDVHALTDAQLAGAVRDDGVDILVDLSGHTAGNRLLAFARRPAPVQVTYLGYPDTTGLDTIDYRFTDALADPPGDADALHSEQLVRLPHGFLCYRAPEDAPPVVVPPRNAGGEVMFASFNELSKLTPPVIETWAAILRAVPRAKLTLKATGLHEEDTGRRVRGAFSAHGVAADRLVLLGRVPSLRNHLALYGTVDVALDPFPYNGATTTCEALWMSVPVVTLAGAAHAGRVGVSLLSRLALADLVADTVERYVDLAVRLAEDTDRRQALRTAMRDRMAQSSLCDAPTTARDLETAYHQMWREWCQSTAQGRRL